MIFSPLKSNARPPLAFSVLVALSGLAASTAVAQEGTATEAAIFKLGAVTVFGEAPSPADQMSVQIDATAIELLEKKDLSATLSSLPGITLTRFGGRNETAVYVHGLPATRRRSSSTACPCMCLTTASSISVASRPTTWRR